MDKDLYHVNFSKHNVGGGSLGARKMTFNFAYAGRLSIYKTRMEVSLGPQCILLKKTKYRLISSRSNTSQRLYWMAWWFA